MTENSKDVAGDIAALLRARNPLIWCTTREEARVEGYLFEACAAAGYVARCWDVAAGVTTMKGDRERNIGSADPGETLEAIRERATKVGNAGERGVWIMRDLPPWLTGPAGMTTCRQVRNLARMLPSVPRDAAQALIIITPNGEVPPELSGHATVIEWPLPDRAEISRLLDAAIAGLPEEMQASAAPNGTRDAAIDAAVGLSGEEAQACYARSLVQHRKIDPATVAKEKKRVIARERVLEWIEPITGGLEAIGGLDLLKQWLTSRKLAYSAAAREYGLPKPKGMLLLGHPGTGKSLCAKAVAAAWGVPLLKLDLGALKSKFVGESEGNLRRALRVIDAVGNCIVWLDEVEKALAGATQGAADGGVSSDALGSILNWMQERGDSGSFVVATANEPNLPPEFMRRGRFDALFFLDLPNQSDRIEIVQTALRANGRAEVSIDLISVATECGGFTGAEIAALVPDALFAAFNDNGRELETDDLIKVARSVVPLSKTAQETFERRREWAKDRMQNATSQQETVVVPASAGRQIDI